VLFRAAQMFHGNAHPGRRGDHATSIFLLTGLGLASGYCAGEALAKIESVASRLLRTPTQNGPDRQAVRQATLVLRFICEMKGPVAPAFEVVRNWRSGTTKLSFVVPAKA